MDDFEISFDFGASDQPNERDDMPVFNKQAPSKSSGSDFGKRSGGGFDIIFNNEAENMIFSDRNQNTGN